MDAQRRGNVVGGAARLELIEEPQALLRERQRQRFRPRLRDERRCRALARGLRRRDRLRQLRQRCHFEQRLERQLHAERRADTRHHLRRQERVPADLEEVIGPADPVDPEDIAPDARQHLLGPGARSRVRLAGLQLRRVRRGQRPAIDLAVGGQRQRVERDERRRHHVVRQLRLERLAQPGHRQLDSRRGNDVGDEALVARHVLADERDARRHAVGRCQHRLDLAELDAVAAQLHLMVDAPEVLERAVGAHAHAIARPVQPISGRRMGSP